ncbi:MULTISPECIES: hypothetical protein [Frankia]|uniref:Uncharacterized protein n=1 Tax=Frankia alni (strain DSM 45986 / CECT 9034 / ACN14a) TaxID=326424 RepID=Q0RGP2_FRAAA|nr:MULTISPECIES: hypothetical protein [Frankia]CAJ63344.1 hypothetical protein FRAAL4702 [Frankia alni ACN14a]
MFEESDSVPGALLARLAMPTTGDWNRRDSSAPEMPLTAGFITCCFLRDLSEMLRIDVRDDGCAMADYKVERK